MHVPGAAEAGVKHHQVTGAKAHRLPAIGGDGDIALQQQAGLLLFVGPGESADLTAPGRPARHTQALQIFRVGVGRNRDAGGHGGLHANRGALSAGGGHGNRR